MANPNPFEKIKIFNYVQTLSKCCKDKEQTTFRLANKDKVCAKVIKAYFKEETYTRAAAPAARGAPANSDMAHSFVKAYFCALRYFKRLDPSTSQASWGGLQTGLALNQVLLDIVYVSGVVGAEPTQATLAGVMAGGGGNYDFSKIIKLTKDDPSGFVPYIVNSIAGSYTDEYLSEMNSKIKKQYNQFGGFKKVSKDVIGSLEDLDRLLRDDLAKQVNDSVFKRYYKTYPMTYQTGGVLGAEGGAVKDAYDAYCAATPEQREVIDCIGTFMFYAQRPILPAPVAPAGQFAYDYSRPLTNGDPAAGLPPGFIRFNLKKLSQFEAGSGNRYNAYTTLLRAAINPPGRSPGGLRDIPVLLLMLPDAGANYPAVLGTAFTYWFSGPIAGAPPLPGGLGTTNHLDLETGVNSAPVNAVIGGAVALGLIQGTSTLAVGPNNIDLTCQPLDKIMSCDDELYDKLTSGDLPEGDDDVEYQFKTDYDKKWNNEVRYDDTTKNIERKNKAGKWETIELTDKAEYIKFFNTSDKCFNSFFRTQNSTECCDLMDLLMKGNYTEFMKKVADGNGGAGMTFEQLDTNFREVNPYTVVKFLEGFKFQKIKEYSPIHGSIYKFPNCKWWKANTLKTLTELTPVQRTIIDGIPNLEALLDMSVAFVNGNINILNPHINSIESTSYKDELLESRNVRRLIPVKYGTSRITGWGPLGRSISGNIMKYMRPYNLSPVLPFGSLIGGQQFTAQFGGNDKKRVEVVLDDTDIKPTFATSIAEDLKTIIGHLKSNNKHLKAEEMKKINDDINAYAKLEVQLYEKMLLINKYIKVSYYLNDNDRESLSESKIKQKIAEYLEYFKDYSNKDMELKNLGSVLKGMINDKL